MENQRIGSKAIRSIVIGCGKFASSSDESSSQDGKKLYSTHLGVLSQFPEIEILGVYDINFERAKESARFWNVPQLKSLQDIENDSIDLAIITTPPEGRLELIESLIQKNTKFIFCEKPVGKTFEEGSAILDLVEKSSSTLLVNFSRVFNPEFKKLASEIQDGTYGVLKHGNAMYGKGLHNNGSHVISTLIFLLGEIKQANKLAIVTDDRKEDPTFDFDLILKNNANINVRGVDHGEYTIMEFDLFFSNGRIRISELGNKIEIYRKFESTIYPGYIMIEPVEMRSTDMRENLYQAYKEIILYFKNNNLINFQNNIARNVENVFQHLDSE